MGFWDLIENAIEGAADFVINTGIIDKIVEIGEGIADWFKDVFNIGEMLLLMKQKRLMKFYRHILKNVLIFQKNMITFQKKK